MKWTLCGQISYDRLELAHCKLAVVGDGKVGKSALIKAAGLSLIDQHEETQYDVYRGTCEVHSHPGVQLEIWDFPGSFTPRLSLPHDLDVIILCLDVTRTETLTSVTARWMPLIRAQCPDQKLLLVGCKSDLRNDLFTIMTLSSLRKNMVTYTDALMIGRLTGSVAYIETSALHCPHSARQVFEVAALRHVGKLSRRHPVFQRQRAVERTCKELQRENQRLAKAQRVAQQTPTSPDDDNVAALFCARKQKTVKCCLM